MTSLERRLEEELIDKLKSLKYEHRADIRDRDALERNFRQKFEALNVVRLSDEEFERLLADIEIVSQLQSNDDNCTRRNDRVRCTRTALLVAAPA